MLSRWFAFFTHKPLNQADLIKSESESKSQSNSKFKSKFESKFLTEFVIFPLFYSLKDKLPPTQLTLSSIFKTPKLIDIFSNNYISILKISAFFKLNSFSLLTFCIDYFWANFKTFANLTVFAVCLRAKILPS